MIKFLVENVCAVISTAAELKKSKDDNEFISFGIKLTVSGKDGSRKELSMSVSMDGSKGDLSVYTAGLRVEISGTVNVRRRDGVQYYNLRADQVRIVPSTEPDKIEGELEFMGKISRNGIDERTDRKGHPYKGFSAFSNEKIEEGKYESVWVRFLYFDPKEGEDFLKADSYVKCRGKLRLNVYRDNITIECLLKEVERWVLDHKK